VSKYSKVAHLKINYFKMCQKELKEVPDAEKIDKLLKIVHSMWFDDVISS